MSEATPERGTMVPLAAILGSAVVLLGVVLTGSLVARWNDPEAYAWAPRLANARLGVALACALFVACAAAAASIRLAAAKKLGPARALLGLALIAGTASITVRVLECPIAARYAGVRLRSPESGPRAKSASGTKAAPVAAALLPPSAERGKPVFMKTCAACHAPNGAGIRGQGASLRDSVFVKQKSDTQLLAFVKVGRQPFDPETRLHLSMPARGGNPSLSDQNLFDAIAVLRELQTEAQTEAQAPAAPATHALAAPAAATPASSDQPQMIDGALWYPHSILAPASVGPRGTAAGTVRLQKPGAAGHSLPNIERFFSIALFVDGLHAMYLAIGLFFGLAIVLGKAPSPRSLVLAAVYWLVIGALGLASVPALYL